jgi:hypothetical protein
MAGLLDLITNRTAPGQASLKNAARAAVAPPLPSTQPDAPPTYEQAGPTDQGGMSDDQLAAASAPTPVATFGAGISQTSSMVKNALAGAAQAVGAMDVNQALRRSAGLDDAEAQRQIEESGSVNSLRDVHGLGDLSSFLGHAAVRNAPQLGAMAAGSALTRGAGRFGQALGTAAPSALLNFGDTYNQGMQEAKTPEEQQRVLAHAAAATPILTALDVAGFSAIKGPGKQALAQAVTASLPAHIRHALVSEGLTEGAQQYVQNTAMKLALRQPEAFGITPDEAWGIADSAAAGAAAGGAFAPVGHAAGVVGAGADLAGKALNPLIDAAGRAMQPNEGTNVPETGTPPPAPPSAGARAGQFMRGIIDGSPEDAAAAGAAAMEKLATIPGVGEALQQGADFLGELRQSKRVARAEAAWESAGDALQQGFENFKQGFGQEIDPAQAQEAFGRYKELVAHALPLDGSMAQAAGEKLATALNGLNSVLLKSAPAVKSIVGDVAQTAQNLGSAAVDTAAVAAPVAGTAAVVGAKAANVASGALADATAGVRQAIKDWRAGNGTPEAVAQAATASVPKDESPLPAAAASNAAQAINDAVGPAAPGVKRAVGLSDDAKVIRAIVKELVPNMPAQEAYTHAKALERLVNDPARFDEMLAQPETAMQVQHLYNLKPVELKDLLFNTLRSQDTHVDTAASIGEPGQHIEGEIAHTAAKGENPGMEVQTPADANPDREIFKRMLQDHEDPKQKAGGKQWVMVTRKETDPATGAVVSEKTEPRQVNLINMAQAMKGSRRMSADDGLTHSQKLDRNFVDSVGQLFNGWKEGNVEYSVQPGTQATAGGKVTAVPRENLEGWLRDNSVIGKAGGVERTFGQAAADRPRAETRPTSSADAMSKMASTVERLKEAGASPDRVQRVREASARRIGSDAVSEIYNLLPQDPQERADADHVGQVVDATREMIEGHHPAAEPVEVLWAMFESDSPDGRAEITRRVAAASRANDVGPLTEGLPEGDPNAQLLHEVAQAIEGDAHVAVQLLPSEVRLAAHDVMLERLDRIHEQLSAPPERAVDEPPEEAKAQAQEPGPNGEVRLRATEVNGTKQALPDRAGLRAEDTPGPVTTDLSGQQIDYAKTEQAGRSVVAARRAASKEGAAQGPKAQAGAPSGQPRKAAVGAGENLDLTTEAGRERARAEIRKIAGDVGIQFIEHGSDAGSYDPEGHVVTLATNHDGALGTAFHESLHAVFSAIDPLHKRELYKQLDSTFVRQQLLKLLKDSPEAQDAIRKDPEELAAYGFQFWKLKLLDLHPLASNWFEKLEQVMDRVWAWMRSMPSAAQTFQRVADGFYSEGTDAAAQAVLAQERTRPLVQQVVNTATRGYERLWDVVCASMDTRLRETGVSELSQIAAQLYARVGDRTEERGLAQSIPQRTKKFLNELGSILGNDANAAVEALRRLANDEPAGALGQKLQGYLKRLYNYQREAGVDLGFVKNYLPMQWSGDKISEQKDQFIDMLRGHAQEIEALNAELRAKVKGDFDPLTPESIANMMANRNLRAGIPSGEVYDANGVPTNHHTEDRVFSFLSNKERAPFVEDNLLGSMTQYVKQSVKRAEYVRRFGEDSGKLEAMMASAKTAGATQQQLQLVRNSLDNIFNVRYNNMNPALRKALGAMQTYQNFRVLGLSVFSSIIDPLVLAVRTQDFGEAWGAYKAAMKSILPHEKSAQQQLAEDIGAIEASGVMDSISDLYGGYDTSGVLKKANDLLFTYNGMNGLTRALRVYATGAGMRFITKHAAAGNERMLAELGLKQSDVRLTPDGELMYRGDQFLATGMSPQQATTSARKVQDAMARFVDESVLHPNAQERPNWGSDPLWGLVFHLKQYIFSFQKIVTHKVIHEINETHSAKPLLTAAPFIPIMGASAFMRDLITYGGALPTDHGFMHYLMAGWDRSGFEGAASLPTDLVTQGPGFVGGPTVDQAIGLTQAIASPGGAHGFGQWLESALPLSSVYKRWT